MARHYGLVTGQPSSGEDSLAGAIALRNWLEGTPYRWLVVFDNAEPGTLDGVVPRNGAGQVIITSRSSVRAYNATTQIIGPLPPAEAADLLAQVADLPADGDALLIASELDGLALAIEQAGAYIRQTRRTYRAYLGDLRCDPQAIYDADLAATESVVARVWRRSLDRVTKRREDHPARAVLGVMSYLARDEIPRDIFSEGVARNATTLSAYSSVRLAVTLSELASYSLIRVESDTIHVHRVIQHISRLEAENADSPLAIVRTPSRSWKSLQPRLTAQPSKAASGARRAPSRRLQEIWLPDRYLQRRSPVRDLQIVPSDSLQLLRSKASNGA